MKKALSILLCTLMIVLCFTGCSDNTEMTEANVAKTVENAFNALTDFDTKKLNKYIDSETLSTIIGYAEKQEQFAKLGKAMFKGLSYEIKNIDLENQTVNITVKNKYLHMIASDFASELKGNYTTFQLIKKLTDKNFLDSSLSELIEKIENTDDNSSSLNITLKVKQGSRNLILEFDEQSEDAVSGGALSAIKRIYNIG